MREFVIPEFGSPGSLGERPLPVAGEGQVLVRVRAAGLNAVDIAVVGGLYKDFMEHRLPLVPGVDFSGTTEAVGPGVTDFAVGDDVFGNVGKRYFGEGTLANAVNPGPGETVVIVGAGGGVGSFATALAARTGARVIAVTRAALAEHAWTPPNWLPGASSA